MAGHWPASNCPYTRVEYPVQPNLSPLVPYDPRIDPFNLNSGFGA
jgi:hypothetical protein